MSYKNLIMLDEFDILFLMEYLNLKDNGTTWEIAKNISHHFPKKTLDQIHQKIRDRIERLNLKLFSIEKTKSNRNDYILREDNIRMVSIKINGGSPKKAIEVGINNSLKTIYPLANDLTKKLS